MQNNTTVQTIKHSLSTECTGSHFNQVLYNVSRACCFSCEINVINIIYMYITIMYITNFLYRML